VRTMVLLKPLVMVLVCCDHCKWSVRCVATQPQAASTSQAAVLCSCVLWPLFVPWPLQVACVFLEDPATKALGRGPFAAATARLNQPGSR
jgi:hypothetical protein